MALIEHSGLPAQTILAAFSRALACALEYEGMTAPNPPVGCVLLDAQGRTLAAAAHEKAGKGHAEALAIAKCRQAGTTHLIHMVIVTLEPCNHTGCTPACTSAILGTPAQEVWIGTPDPNPCVDGGGAEKLAADGLSVGFIGQLSGRTFGNREAAKLVQAARRLVAPFARHTSTGLPWVTVKQAINRSGGMIPEAGKKTFTSKKSLLFAHRLRKRADAIITGSGTILADSPEFTVRHLPDFKGKRRHLVIMDRRGRVPVSYIAQAARVGFEVRKETQFEESLIRLGRAGVQQVLVEAGPTLLEAVLGARLWDEHVIITEGAGPQGDDEIIIRGRWEPFPVPEKEERHVLRHH
jgi:diaminohydroxyphosphoribosylaminopyrimidine deaminase / 5-amino-6-(5-phosphoribosylamino)uracil reductase